ncbi:hypothetical protein MHM88_04820 [Epibacterium sp. MM17-32]|uniref:hypothetical protein n=1 Tax=Epibacterium sp. MM17-32 TaxID=2917734 RepID=UPI001EF73D6D|nr:hypothetical protein [Epibacterium sp. MM17-32]MCG7627117.1 hypothetical protein [Epibacterium sp. MM17-32]
MLVDIYARTLLNATRHGDLPQRPLPQPYRAPRRRLGALRRLISALWARRPQPAATGTPRCDVPVACK